MMSESQRASFRICSINSPILFQNSNIIQESNMPADLSDEYVQSLTILVNRKKNVEKRELLVSLDKWYQELAPHEPRSKEDACKIM